MSELAKTGPLIFNESFIRFGTLPHTHCHGCCKDAEFPPRLVKKSAARGREVSDMLSSELMKGGGTPSRDACFRVLMLVGGRDIRNRIPLTPAGRLEVCL